MINTGLFNKVKLLRKSQGNFDRIMTGRFTSTHTSSKNYSDKKHETQEWTSGHWNTKHSRNNYRQVQFHISGERSVCLIENDVEVR